MDTCIYHRALDGHVALLFRVLVDIETPPKNSIFAQSMTQIVKLICFLILMQLLPSGPKGRDLAPSLLSMMKETKNTCVIYDFEENRIRTGKPAWSNEERRKVLQALNKHGFIYNGEKDTLLIRLSYVDWLVPACPVHIDAFSSRKDLHLSLRIGEGNEYDVDGPPINTMEKYDPFGEEDALPDIIKSNDMDAFKAIYDKYHDLGLGVGPDHVLRMEILDNKLVSFSEWIFEIGVFNYRWDQWSKAQGTPNKNGDG